MGFLTTAGNFLKPIAQQAIGSLVGMGIGQNVAKQNDQRQLQQQENLARLGLHMDKQRMDYQNEKQLEMWEKTNYKAQVDQMKKAGLSIGLMYGNGGGGGATTGGNMPTSNVGQAPVGGGEIMGMLQLRSQEAQIELMKAQAEKASAEANKTKGVDTKLGETQIENLTQGIENQKAIQELTKIQSRISNLELNLKEESFESKFFNNISVISTGVAKKLDISNFTLLPLGANVIAKRLRERRILDKINLLYVGTFNGRNIDITIEAVRIIKNKRPDLTINYKIFGDGVSSEIAKIRNAILSNDLNDVVDLAGFLRHDELENAFVEADIGVAYVPVTEFYNVQPSTKIYEYIRSGIPVIATNTDANCEIMDESFGIVVGETPQDFADGMLRLVEKINAGDIVFSKSITEQYSWENVVNKLEFLFERMV